MPLYHQLGIIPAKRHTQFRKPDGKLYYEELFGTIGFDGMSSLLYHIHRPTQVSALKSPQNCTPKIAVSQNIQSRKLIGGNIATQKDYLEAP